VSEFSKKAISINGKAKREVGWDGMGWEGETFVAIYNKRGQNTAIPTPPPNNKR